MKSQIHFNHHKLADTFYYARGSNEQSIRLCDCALVNVMNTQTHQVNFVMAIGINQTTKESVTTAPITQWRQINESCTRIETMSGKEYELKGKFITQLDQLKDIRVLEKLIGYERNCIEQCLNDLGIGELDAQQKQALVVLNELVEQQIEREQRYEHGKNGLIGIKKGSQCAILVDLEQAMLFPEFIQ